MNHWREALRSKWHVLVLFLLWTLFGLFVASKMIIESRFYGNPFPAFKAIWWWLLESYTWGLLAIAIFRLARWTSRQQRNWPLLITLHVFNAILLCTLQGFLVSIGGAVEMWLKGWPQTQRGEYSFREAATVTIVNHFHTNLLIYAGVLLAWHTVDYYRHSQERALHAAHLETRLKESQLLALRSQLQPHFLFNTLNSIAELIHQDPERAEGLIIRLSDLLRLTLQSEARPEVSLRDEMEMLRRYVEIEQVRLGDRITVEWNVLPETLSAKVPNFILQPLVENAIRHGIAPVMSAGRLSISARRQQNHLLLEVSDNGQGLDHTRGQGIGLSNTAARLRGLYGSEQTFELLSRDGLCARVTIPFSPSLT